MTPTSAAHHHRAGQCARDLTLLGSTRHPAKLNVTICPRQQRHHRGLGSAAGSLTFTTANWNVAQTVTVTGVDDALADGSIGYTIVTGLR